MGTNIPPAANSGGVALPSGRVTLASPATSITISGLSGNTDGDYELTGTLILSAAAVNNLLTLQPNGDSANATSNASLSAVAGASANQTVNLQIGAPNTSGLQVTVTFLVRFCSKSGDGNHGYFSSASYFDAIGRTAITATGQYTSTSTAITSLVIASNQAGSIAAASFVRWRALGFTA